MTGEGGYLDDTLLVDSNHNVRTVMCFDTGILSSNHKKHEFQYLIFDYSL
ncbi:MULTISPECIES: hypothetical protein [unclassified Wolbachia]|nr:hypothetical protein [Wolbachia endosymbiont (group A) of Apoderus coryli]